ncbi:MAG: type II toxin-antitoxin system VapC family toxin [Acidimicrobiia bacterium]|nr:type II toxin-antitoxin system VapC family toxin [Acidimicrobiia bacterium]
MYVLDTVVVSETRKIRSGRADPGVASWVARVDHELAYISAITIQELELGVLLAEGRDPVSGVVLRRWLDNDVYEAFDGRILPVDATVARFAASLHVPDPAPVSDALIGATAMANNMVLATRKTRNFGRFRGLEVLNPWKFTEY